MKTRTITVARGQSLLRTASLLVLLGLLGACTTVPLSVSRGAACQPSRSLAFALSSPDAGAAASEAKTQDSKPLHGDYTEDEISSGLEILTATDRDPDRQRLLAMLPATALSVPWISEYSASFTPSAAFVAAGGDAKKQIDEATPFSQALVNFERHDRLSTSLGSVSTDEAHLVGLVGKTVSLSGYDAATLGSLGRVKALVADRANSDQLDQEFIRFNAARFVSTYFRAYFRGGRILQAGVDTNALADKAADNVIVALNHWNLSSTQKTQLTQLMESKLKDGICRDNGNVGASTACLVTRPLGTEEFITRSGDTVQFAGLSATFGENGKLTPSVTYPKVAEWGPQVARVFWEAMFDSAGEVVPSVANSTECQNKLIPDTACIADTSSDVSTKLKTVDQYASQAESATSTAVGYLIRGGWWLSLNNEAVAETIETSAGTIARKSTEKLVWAHVAGSCASSPIQVSVVSDKDY
jgi:hypothetical protein